MSIFDDIAKALEDAAAAVLEGLTDGFQYVINGIEVALDTVIGGVSSGAKACADFVEGVAFVVVRDATSAADALRQTAEETWTSVRALAEAKSAPPPLAMGARVSEPDGTVHLMIDGRLRRVPGSWDGRLFREGGAFIEIARAGAYPTGEPLDGEASLRRDPVTGRIYLLGDGARRWIVGPHVFDRYGFAWNAVEDALPETLARIPEGSPISGEYIPEGRRVTDPASGKVYVMLGGALRHIPDPVAYNALFRDWKGIGAVGNLGGQRLEPPLPGDVHLAIQPGGTIFLVSDGVKRWVSGPAVMDRYHFSWSAVRPVPAEVLNRIPDGAAIA